MYKPKLSSRIYLVLLAREYQSENQWTMYMHQSVSCLLLRFIFNGQSNNGWHNWFTTNLPCVQNPSQTGSASPWLCPPCTSLDEEQDECYTITTTKPHSTGLRLPAYKNTLIKYARVCTISHTVIEWVSDHANIS